VLAAPVAQTCSLSVSAQIVASSDDVAERGSVSRSTCERGGTNYLRRSLSCETAAPRRGAVRRGSVSRSTLRAAGALDLSKRCTTGKAPAGHRPALLWLRLRRAAPYRRFSTCQLSPARNVPPIPNRRYGRLKICATLNTYELRVGQARRPPYSGRLRSSVVTNFPAIAIPITQRMFKLCRR